MLFACHCLVRCEVCSLFVVIEAPDMIFGCVCDLWYNIGGIEALLLGEKPLNILPLELFPCQCVLLCPFCQLCGLTKYTLVGAALSPTLTVDMTSVGPSDPQVFFSPGHICTSAEVRSQDCSSCTPGDTGSCGGSSDSGLPQPLHVHAYKACSC